MYVCECCYLPTNMFKYWKSDHQGQYILSTLVMKILCPAALRFRQWYTCIIVVWVLWFWSVISNFASEWFFFSTCFCYFWWLVFFLSQRPVLKFDRWLWTGNRQCYLQPDSHLWHDDILNIPHLECVLWYPVYQI